MGSEETSNKHDATRNGECFYQPDKMEKPKDYGRGKHDKDDPKKK